MANMLASLSSTQSAAAKLSQTFSDLTMSPGETNGGNGTFPATKVGIAVSTLSDAQKLLVLEAIKPWVRDMDDTVAANLLAIYQNELNGTYIAYTGSGTSGDASTFLNANTDYARIDGPSVWVEFICQSGVVFRNQIHYHTIWRDHTRDYGADLSLTTPLDSTSETATPTPTATPTTTRRAFDFDGDGKADISVYRPSNGVWYLLRSTQGFGAAQFAISTDKPAVGDYDGDGRADEAVYRADTGTWYLFRSSGGFASVQFGLSTDTPSPGDYDGDGKTDVAAWRETNGTFYILKSADNSLLAAQWGLSTDLPIAAFDSH